MLKRLLVMPEGEVFIDPAFAYTYKEREKVETNSIVNDFQRKQQEDPKVDDQRRKPPLREQGDKETKRSKQDPEKSHSTNNRQELSEDDDDELVDEEEKEDHLNGVDKKQGESSWTTLEKSPSLSKYSNTDGVEFVRLPKSGERGIVVCEACPRKIIVFEQDIRTHLESKAHKKQSAAHQMEVTRLKKLQQNFNCRFNV